MTAVTVIAISLISGCIVGTILGKIALGIRNVIHERKKNKHKNHPRDIQN